MQDASTHTDPAKPTREIPDDIHATDVQVIEAPVLEAGPPLPAAAEERLPTILTAKGLEEFKLAVVRYKEILLIALSLTNPQDWVNMGGRPYLQASGVEKIRAPFGIRWYGLQTTRHDRGDWYMYVTTGYVESSRLGGEPVQVTGTRTSRDKFFAMETEWFDDPERPGKRASRKVLLPMEEVNEPDIMKSSITNFRSNAISQYLGLRNLTWQDVKRAGINLDDVPTVDYKVKKELGEADEKGGSEKSAESKGGASSESSTPHPADTVDEGREGEPGGHVRVRTKTAFELWNMSHRREHEGTLECPNGHVLVIERFVSGQYKDQEYFRCPQGCTSNKDKRGRKWNMWGFVAKDDE